MAAWGEDDRQKEIARVIRTVITRYEWQLVEEDWLITRVGERLATLPPTAGKADIERLCKDEVSWELFDACMRGGLRSASAEERARQEQAYHDLGSYLSCIAVRLRRAAPGVESTDLVQETLIAIRQDYAKCKQPQVFLEWAVEILRNKRADSWRKFGDETSLDALMEACGEQGVEVMAVAPRVRDRHVDPAGDQELFCILHECLDTDEERLLAFMGIMGLKRREIGMLLDAPLARWDRARMAVKRKLEDCPHFLALFERGRQAN